MTVVDSPVLEYSASKPWVCEQACAERAAAHAVKPAREHASGINGQDRMGKYHRITVAEEDDAARTDLSACAQTNLARFVKAERHQLLGQQMEAELPALLQARRQ